MWNVYVLQPGHDPVKLNHHPYTAAQVAVLLECLLQVEWLMLVRVD